MAEVSTSNIDTIGYVVHRAKADFKLEDIVLTEMQDDELLVDMKYSGICHTVSYLIEEWLGILHPQLLTRM
jgi:Zn-dependent alcohol dehydrogenase